MADSPVAMETEPPAPAQAGAAYSKCCFSLHTESKQQSIHILLVFLLLSIYTAAQPAS